MSSKAMNGTKHLCENMSFASHEAIKKLRTNLGIVLPQSDGCKVIGITSAQPGEGKSVSSINLAYSFAELGRKILLIDADLHRPTIGEKLAMTGEIGFGDLLTSANEISSAVVPYVSSGGQTGFDVILTKPIENTSELLSSPRFSALLKALSEAYDYIFIDLPPIGAVIDAVIVGKHTDGMIVIARENETLKKQFDNCIKQLEFAGIKIFGLVFNGSMEGADKKYQRRYGYY